MLEPESSTNETIETECPDLAQSEMKTDASIQSECIKTLVRNAEQGDYDAIKSLEEISKIAEGQNKAEALRCLGEFYSSEKIHNKLFDKIKANECFKNAIELLEKAAEQGDMEAAYRLGQIYDSSNIFLRHNASVLGKKAAIRCYIRAAELGHAGAAEALGGLFYGDRDESTKWFNKAIELYEKAAKQGDMEAAYRIGNILDEYHYVTEDYDPKRIEWYTRAAKLGHVGAIYRLGEIYHSNCYIPDQQEAIKWFKRAAELGVGDAFFELGKLCAGNLPDNATPRPQDFANAIKFFNKALKSNLCSTPKYEVVSWLEEAEEKLIKCAKMNLTKTDLIAVKEWAEKNLTEYNLNILNDLNEWAKKNLTETNLIALDEEWADKNLTETNLIALNEWAKKNLTD